MKRNPVDKLITSRYEDKRINAPLISWKVYLILLGIEVCIMAIHTATVTIWMNKIPEQFPILLVVVFYYMLLSSLVLALLFGVLKRYVFGKPLKRIAAAARKVAAGEFSVRIDPIRRDGKKDEVEVLIDDFNTMARELESIEMLKNDFISNVSHEIKTPLSVIQREQYADTVIRTTRKLNHLVVNVLRLSKLQIQDAAPETSVYQLGEQIRQCALGFMDHWEEKGIRLRMDVEDVAVRTDRSLMELVWNNLLSNAVKFTGEGGIISVNSRVQEDKVEIQIRDTGCGIPEEALPRIFDKFYQGDTSHATEGNGLGLALVKRILDLVSGEIRVESHPGEGSVFTVILPLGI